MEAPGEAPQLLLDPSHLIHKLPYQPFPFFAGLPLVGLFHVLDGLVDLELEPVLLLFMTFELLPGLFQLAPLLQLLVFQHCD